MANSRGDPYYKNELIIKNNTTIPKNIRKPLENKPQSQIGKPNETTPYMIYSIDDSVHLLNH